MNLRLLVIAHITGVTSKTRKLTSVPWANDNGGGGSKGPWGESRKPPEQPGQPKPQLSGGVRPPDFESLLRKLKADLARYLPAGLLGKRGAWALGFLAVGVWLALGFYTVSDNEQGVLLRFGAFVRHVGPGTYWHLPWPIETAYTPNVKKQNQLDIGFKPASDTSQPAEDKPDEAYMFTGDGNIVDLQFSVFWRIKDANAYLFNVDRGKDEDVVKAVAESAMREVVSQESLAAVMKTHREAIQVKVQKGMQAILDSYNAGIAVEYVKMKDALTPAQVRGADSAVAKALDDQDKKRSDAEAYKNKVIPLAEGEAAAIKADAEAYKAAAIAAAHGEADRFNAIYQEYKKAPEVTRRRIYLETMTAVLGPMNKIIVDDAAHGVTLQLGPAAAKPAAAVGAKLLSAKPVAAPAKPAPGKAGSK
jgi:membrane protease subunit HflK